jgi:hypothetical protein|tara:strand:+ start:529 stop:672 length:144 start_codon:yes stop_codon:yes gene_type:complete
MTIIDMQINMTADIEITEEDIRNNFDITLKELIIAKILEDIDHHHIE